MPTHLDSLIDTWWPVMIAFFVDAKGPLKAVHRTDLSKEGTGKAPVAPPRITLGAICECACRLSEAGKNLAVAEGIEMERSFQIMTGTPIWAALSAGGIRSLLLPPLPLASFVTFAAADSGALRSAPFRRFSRQLANVA